MIVPVIAIITGCFAGGMLFFAMLWDGAKSTAKYNLEGWERASRIANNEREYRDHHAKKSHEAEERAEVATAKLRKYGLEDA